jgi:hypothetical protein
MPRFGKKRIVAVDLENVQTYLYGWYTSLDAAGSTVFGHIDLTSPAPKPTIFGATRPKPQRSTHKQSGATSFISKALKTSPLFQLVKKEKLYAQPSSGSSRSQRVYVDFHGVKYAWNQPTEVATKAGSLSGLGVSTVNSTVKPAIGVNNVMIGGVFMGKPPRARKIVDSSGDVDTVSCFYDISKDLPAGWF